MARPRVIQLGVGLAGILLLASCATGPESTSDSDLIRSNIQSDTVLDAPEIFMPDTHTRDFEAGKQIVFDSVISVFEDREFVMSQADPNSGTIIARGALRAPFSVGVSQEEQPVASAFIREIGEDTRVTLHFAIRTRSAGGGGQRPYAPESSAYQTGETYHFEFELQFPSDDSRPTIWKEEAILEADVYHEAFELIAQAVSARS